MGGKPFQQGKTRCATCQPSGLVDALEASRRRRSDQAPESMAKKAFDFNSTVDSRRLSTLVYHSAHGISNIPSNIQRIFPADRLPLAGRQSTPGLGSDVVNVTMSSTVDTSIPFSARHFEYSVAYLTFIPCRQTAVGWGQMWIAPDPDVERSFQ
eukprot:1188291-Prorocentrum_minimum.AAC.3